MLGLEAERLLAAVAEWVASSLEPSELVFDAESSLVTVLRRSDQPIPGALCRLTAFGGRLAVTPATSDELGLAR